MAEVDLSAGAVPVTAAVSDNGNVQFTLDASSADLQAIAANGFIISGTKVTITKVNYATVDEGDVDI